MSYKHLTINERNKIEVLNKEGYSSRRIAKILGFHHSTIPRELKRCSNEYEDIYAQKDKIEKSSSKGRKPKADDNITKSIFNVEFFYLQHKFLCCKIGKKK